MITTKTETTISNNFTDYFAAILTNGKPSVTTIQKHLRKSKASDCQSVTTIEIDGIRHDLIDLGRGLTLTQH